MNSGTGFKRTIIIGDVHGCFAELHDLLSLVDAKAEDELISVGDLVCKGPDIPGVMNWAMETRNLKCIMGNHELRLLQKLKAGGAKDNNGCESDTIRQLGSSLKKAVRFIETWPFYIERPGFTVIHAGFDPRRGSFKDQDPFDLTNIRLLPGTNTPWYDEYKKDHLIVFGHWASNGLVQRKNVIGLDSGCVYGRSLSAIILPERRLVSVPARKVYAQPGARKNKT